MNPLRRLPLLLLGLPSFSFAQSEEVPSGNPGSEEEIRSHNARIDSVEASYHYQTGSVPIGEGVATIELPPDFKFLDAEQSRQVLTELWGNPPSVAENVAGMILGARSGVYDDSFVLSIEYDTIGYVSDADASRLDYDAMLQGMLKDDSLENVQRLANGYDPLYLVGWASPPHYDKDRKALHWAQELMRGEDSSRVLNYNIRVLGRKGVIILNAMGSMDHLDSVRTVIPAVLSMVTFNDGYRYDQFDPRTDAAAQWTVGGLIDGKVRENMEKAAGILKVIAIAFGVGLLIIVLVVWLIYRRKRTA